MAKAIKLSDQLVADATRYAKVFHRSPPKQIEHWATIGRVAEENPDLPLRFVINILMGLEEAEAGELSEYRFG
ncbi:MAG: hypothetical protein OXE42_11225 [Gammaproteobacteria bacterium]|nr:hypothetical protein [Gammaproteobacteria bacterium]